MLLLNSISAVLILVVILLSGYRLIVYRRMVTIEQTRGLSKKAREKFRRIKKREQDKHSKTLLVNGVLLCLIGLCTILSLMKMEEQEQYIVQQIEAQKKEIFSLKKEQLLSEKEVTEYPELGIGLNENQWAQVISNETNSTVQSEIETTVSKQVRPYFGLSTIIISPDTKEKTIYLAMSSMIEKETSEKVLDENRERFIQEMKAVPEVQKLYFQLKEVSETKGEIVKSYNYQRSNGEHDFELIHETELKMNEDE